jgi:polynucleotide 5'-kinase involved in rRNA processing
VEPPKEPLTSADSSIVPSTDTPTAEWAPIQKKVKSTPSDTKSTKSKSTTSLPGATATTPSTPTAAFKNVKQMAPTKRKELEQRIAEQQKTAKKSVNLVVIGHVDSGKSTLMGQLLVQLGYIDKKLIHK